jgi:hypothetical protein
MREGCKKCGARAVGDPLPKPEQELPAYGRSLLLTLSGIAMVLGFLAETIAALLKNAPAPPPAGSIRMSIFANFSFGFWDWIAAGETAAWRLKWISIPVAFVALWGGRRIYNSMLANPTRFVGMKIARRGLIASTIVPMLIATLIGVTVPARLRQRRISIEAGLNAKAYTLVRAQLEYQAIHGAFPGDINDLAQLPDPDGSIAAALKDIDPAGYQPRSDIAVLPEKPRRLPGAALRNASISTPSDDTPGGLAFTNYDLRLPGEDKILRTEDDLFIRDGVVLKASEVKDAPIPVRTRTRVGRR